LFKINKGTRVQGLGFGVWVAGYMSQGVGLSLGFKDSDLGLRVYG
jgi:hypothetical protein